MGLETLAEQFAAQALRFELLALDTKGADDGFVENINVIVGEGASPITEGALPKIAAAAKQEVERSGVAYESLSQSVVRIGDVRCARLEGRITMAGQATIRTLSYYLPGRDRHAVPSYTPPKRPTNATSPSLMRPRPRPGEPSSPRTGARR